MAIWQKLSSGLGSLAYLLYRPLTNGLDSPERPLRPLLAGRSKETRGGDEGIQGHSLRPHNKAGIRVISKVAAGVSC